MHRTLSCRCFGLVTIFALAGTPATLHAQVPPAIEVFPALAPNAFGSPSYPTWEANAVAAIHAGATTGGDPALSSFYQQIPGGSVIQPFVVTDFHSWLLRADPGTVFGPAFAGELGNRLEF